ncbi:MAG: hypothetical protein ACI9J2_002736, partial [Saprospiraceae bacterium]
SYLVIIESSNIQLNDPTTMQESGFYAPESNLRIKSLFTPEECDALRKLVMSDSAEPC